MKKLGKLSINLERVMKNEELVNLRGGDYYGYGEACTCTCINYNTYDCAYVLAPDGNCANTCREFYGTTNAAGGCGNLYDLCSIKLPG